MSSSSEEESYSKISYSNYEKEENMSANNFIENRE